MLSFVEPDVNIDYYADDNTIMYSGYNLNDIKLKLVNNINRLLRLVICNRLVNLGISKQQHLYLKTKNLI